MDNKGRIKHEEVCTLNIIYTYTYISLHFHAYKHLISKKKRREEGTKASRFIPALQNTKKGTKKKKG